MRAVLLVLTVEAAQLSVAKEDHAGEHAQSSATEDEAGSRHVPPGSRDSGLLITEGHQDALGSAENSEVGGKRLTVSLANL